jgi:uncharacterized protein YcaQ
VPPPEDAMKQLICLAAAACGVATAGDLTAYFYIDDWRDRLPPGPWWEKLKSPEGRRPKSIAKRLVAELVEDGRLLPAKVDGWQEQAYLHPRARVPDAVDAQTFVTPFDSLVWERSRMLRLFGMKYTIEIYTPADKRIYGYYVCPFLLGDTLVARADLKADRANRVLKVQSAFLEPRRHPGRTASAMADALRQMQEWLALDGVDVARRGNLARTLRAAVTARKRTARR